VVGSRNTSKKRKIKSNDIVLGDVVVSVHQEPQKTEQRNDRAKMRDNGTKMEQKGTAQGTGNDRSKLGIFIPQRVILSPQPHDRPSSLACSNSHDGLARLSQKLAQLPPNTQAHFQPERLAIIIVGKSKRFQEKATQGHRRRVETSGG
jgi:hypothetical protein